MSQTQPVFLTAEWRHLVILNFEIDPKLLLSRIPAGTELDFWNDRTYVSMVGFRFLNTKVMGLPIPFHRHFDEVNLRFYLRRKAPASWRRGVAFIKEIVPVPAVALVARWVYHENYITLPMRHQIAAPRAIDDGPEPITYSWKWRGAWAQLGATVSGAAGPLLPGSEEEFITEHYWGHSAQPNGSTMEYAVEHPPWHVRQATSSHFQCDVHSLYGPEFVDVLNRQPTSAFVADGSAIIVRKGTRLSP